MKRELWYAKTGSGGQALIISELDGRNVAVVYDSKDAPLLAAAPLMAARLLDIYNDRLSAGAGGGITMVTLREILDEAGVL